MFATKPAKPGGCSFCFWAWQRLTGPTESAWRWGGTVSTGTSVKFPKLTVCYHCYAKYRNCRVNPEHHEYDLEKMESFEKAIRNDRTSRDFR